MLQSHKRKWFVQPVSSQNANVKVFEVRGQQFRGTCKNCGGKCKTRSLAKQHDLMENWQRKL